MYMWNEIDMSHMAKCISKDRGKCIRLQMKVYSELNVLAIYTIYI